MDAYSTLCIHSQHSFDFVSMIADGKHKEKTAEGGKGQRKALQNRQNPCVQEIRENKYFV